MRSRPAIVVSLVMLLVASAIVPASAASRTYTTHLTGAEEVVAGGGGVDTQAQGQARFKVAKDGQSIEFRLVVANIEDVVAAHIHIAPAGTNGLVAVTLYGGGLLPGSTNGVLATGTITAGDLIGPLAGQPLSALIAEIEAGNVYVNVHTVANGGGEIRGQL